MATAMPFAQNTPEKEIFKEPCMRCFASVTYARNEPVYDAQKNRYILKCPCCGHDMHVNFCSEILC